MCNKFTKRAKDRNLIYGDASVQQKDIKSIKTTNKQ